MNLKGLLYRVSLFLLICLSCLFFPCLASATDLASIQNSTLPHPIRALHVQLEYGINPVTPEMVKRIIKDAQGHGFNTLIILLANKISFKSLRIPFNGKLWSTEEFLEVSNFAKQHGMELVPEVNLLTHQEKFFEKNYPDLMYNHVTYDPRQPAVYQLVFAYLDEIIALLHPPAILIGHDEVAGQNGFSKEKWWDANEKMLPADLFLEDVNRIHEYLNKKNIQIWMWGDMLIESDEFPGMPPRDLNRTPQGYGRQLRNKLSKDIVICDWHYGGEQTGYPMLDTFKAIGDWLYGGEQTGFPTIDAFKADGFRVLGATWKNSKTIRNFSRYAATHGADGMIATTWFHVPQQDWDVVERIMRESGDAFRKDFPDAK